MQRGVKYTVCCRLAFKTKTMETIVDLVSDEMIEKVFKNTNFGQTPKRYILSNTLLKCACGYNAGHTATLIVKRLGLVTEDWKLSMWGKRYLYAAYSVK